LALLAVAYVLCFGSLIRGKETTLRWLLDNQARVKSCTVLPDYLSVSIEWYLRGHPDILSSRQPLAGPQTTSFPTTPDLLIMGRRHHIREPVKLIAAYQAHAGEVQTILSISGFELYAREKLIEQDWQIGYPIASI
jgi:hypothetical protein